MHPLQGIIYQSTSSADCVIKLRQCAPQCTNNANGCCLFSSACAPEFLPDIFTAPSYVWAHNPEIRMLSLKRTSSAIFAILTPVVPGTSYKPIKTSCRTRSWSTYLKQIESCSVPETSCVPSIMSEYCKTGSNWMDCAILLAIQLPSIWKISFWLKERYSHDSKLAKHGDVHHPWLWISKAEIDCYIESHGLSVLCPAWQGTVLIPQYFRGSA